MSIDVTTAGSVTTIVIDRADVRNAVDGPTAAALADAFRAFDTDESQAVAVLAGADEALRIGLVDRVVDPGSALVAAQMLAAEIAELPQACLRNDRRSALEQEGCDEMAAMRGEFELGLASLADGGFEGAARFVDGAGRHGAPS